MVIFSVLYLYPIWLSLTNYQRTGSRDYLIFAGIFIGQSIHWNLFPFHRVDLSQNPPGNFFLTMGVAVSFSGWMFLTFLHVLRLRWKEKPSVFWLIGAGIIGVWWITRPLVLFSYLPYLIFSYLPWLPIFAEIFRFYMRRLFIYAYFTIKPDYSDQ